MKPILTLAATILCMILLSCTGEYTSKDKLIDGLESNNFNLIKKALYEEPQLINFVDRSNNSLMHHAIKSGNDSLFNHLIERDAPLNHSDNLGKTPIYYLDEPSKMGKLVLSGAKLNVKDSLGNTLYHEYDDKHMLQRLIELAVQDVQIDKRNKKGLTALMQAIINDEFIKVQMLVNKYADVRSTNPSGLNCVQIAKEAGNYKIYEYVKNQYDRVSNFSKMKVQTIHSETVKLTGENINTSRSYALSEVNIPKDCDELIFIGYGNSEKAKVIKKLDQLIDIGTTLYGSEAEKAYDEFKKFHGTSSDSRVDFFLTRIDDGNLIKSDPDYIDSAERFAHADNVSSFSLKLEREVNFPPENKFIKVIKNEDGFNQATFTTQIVSVTFPRDDYEEQLDEVEIIKDNNHETASLPINPFGKSNESETSIVLEPRITKSLINSKFYQYPTLNKESITSIYFIQGGAKRTLNEAEKYASLYKQIGFNVWIFKKQGGDFPFKILIDHLNDKEIALGKIKLINSKYRKYGDLAEAYIVTRSKLME